MFISSVFIVIGLLYVWGLHSENSKLKERIEEMEHIVKKTTGRDYSDLENYYIHSDDVEI